MRLATEYAHPAEGDLMVVALADETYCVVQRIGDNLMEPISGFMVHAVEIVAAEHLEPWPFGDVEPFSEGDEVLAEVVEGRSYEQGRVLHTHGGEAWVRLIGGASMVLPQARLKPI